MGTDHEHRVCTYKEAEAAIKTHDKIYMNDCFCRRPARDGETTWDYCGHPVETCMGFHEPTHDEPDYDYKEISREKALEIFEDWKSRGNLFRFMEDESWICCCCSCGCQWFRDKAGNITRDPCDKSGYIEDTDPEMCNLCGQCVDTCPYDARTIEGDSMVITSEECYGCSACEYVCPEDAIQMVPRG